MKVRDIGASLCVLLQTSWMRLLDPWSQREGERGIGASIGVPLQYSMWF